MAWAPGLASSCLTLLADDGSPISLRYGLKWGTGWRLHEAVLVCRHGRHERSLQLRRDEHGRWHGPQGHMPELDACAYIDIWPTPFTNTFPIRGERLRIGERRTLWVAWVSAPELTVQAQQQAYTRLDKSTYRFESLDGSGFAARLPIDAHGLVLDYPRLFLRVRLDAAASKLRGAGRPGSSRER